MSPESCSALRVPWWFHPCCSPLNLSPGAPRAVWLTRPRIKLPIYFGTIHSEGPKTQIRSIPLCVYLQLLTLLRTNLQIQTNARCVMGLEKQSGRGWGCARRNLRGGRAGRGGSPGKDYQKFNFYSDNNRGYFLPMTSRSQPAMKQRRWCWWKSRRTLLVFLVANIPQFPLLKTAIFFLFKCLTTTQILSAGSADPRINHSIPSPCE